MKLLARAVGVLSAREVMLMEGRSTHWREGPRSACSFLALLTYLKKISPALCGKVMVVYL